MKLATLTTVLTLILGTTAAFIGSRAVQSPRAEDNTVLAQFFAYGDQDCSSNFQGMTNITNAIAYECQVLSPAARAVGAVIKVPGCSVSVYLDTKCSVDELDVGDHVCLIDKIRGPSAYYQSWMASCDFF